MIVCCVSDLHGYLPEIPDCQFVCVAGDILPVRFQNNIDLSRAWLDSSFRTWLKEIYDRGIVTIGIAGNHDFIFQEYPETVPKELHWAYLQDESFEFEGLKFWGTPWQPYYGGWAFNLYEEQLVDKWELIPDNTDVVIVHGSPYLHGDKVTYLCDGDFIGEHVGSPSLLRRIEKVKPKLVVCGHIHQGRGVYQAGETLVVNASLVNDKYQPVHSAIVVRI